MPQILTGKISSNTGLILFAILAAFGGAWLGNRYLKKINIKWIKIITAIGVILIGIALAIGLI